MTSRPHDALFRSAFEHPRDAEGELRHVLPEELATAIDWKTLTHQPGSFVDPALADRHSDVLFSVQLAGETALVYLLLEHQSTSDDWMPLRVLIYMARIWEQRMRDCQPGGLPPIVTVVVSHAVGGWTAPTHLHELLGAHHPGLAGLVPSLRIIVDDLAGVSDESLRSRALSVFPMVALWLLRDGRSPEALIEGLAAWAEACHAVLRAPSGLAAFTRLLRYVDLVLSERQFERFRGMLIHMAPGTEKATMSYGDRMHTKGREEGREEGQRALLLRQLALRFGGVDDELRAKVGGASSPELERWAERILDASSLSDVFAD